MSSADLPTVVPRASCQTHAAPGPTGTTGDSISGYKRKVRCSLSYRARAIAVLLALRQRGLLQPCQRSVPTKGTQVLANAIGFFLKKFAFPVHLRRLSARFVSLSSKGLFKGTAYSLVIQETTIL